LFFRTLIIISTDDETGVIPYFLVVSPGDVEFNYQLTRVVISLTWTRTMGSHLVDIRQDGHATYRLTYLKEKNDGELGFVDWDDTVLFWWYISEQGRAFVGVRHGRFANGLPTSRIHICEVGTRKPVRTCQKLLNIFTFIG